MKKVMCLAAVMVLSIGLAAFPAMASDVEVSTGVDLNSAYVWRGMTFNDGLVAQPSLDVTKGGFGVNVWGNFDIDDYDGALESSEFSEIDLTLSYGFSLGGLDAGIGYIEYLFPAGGEGTREVYLSLSKGITDSFSAGLDIYYDIDEVDDYYAVLNLVYSLGISENTSLDVGASAAYAGDEYCGDGDAGLYDYTLSLSLGHTINDHWSISCGITYVDALDDEKLAEVSDGGLLDVNTYGGISIGYAF